ncbi:response regulator transcription factor [Rubinisphaera sp.]|uniref:response regulator transcription factor n=1 Tax=Rubinisphaera sp. TaxID=2024857 RepID=UPI0025CDC855|nr:response regulator transcription factor [Rubinisphaera sp.]
MSNSLIIFQEAEFIGEAIRCLLVSWQLFENVFIVRELKELNSQLRDTSGPVILLPSEIPTKSIQELILQIRERDSTSRIIIFVQQVSQNCINNLPEEIPEGVINQNDPLEEIFSAFRKVIHGQFYFSKSIENRSLQKPGKRTGKKDRNGLTPRQREVLCKLAEGYTVKEIAEMMKLSAKAIDSQKYRIMKKLNLNDRVRLARFAIREGMIDP